MAAPTINANLTNINLAATTTDWSGFTLSGGATPSPQQDTDIFIEGAAAVSVKVSGSADKGVEYDIGVGNEVDFTVAGRHLWVWVNNTTPGNLTTFDGSSSWGLYIIVSSGGIGSDYLAWSVRDRTSKPAGWTRYVIDCNKPPSRSSGTTDLTALRYFGAGVDQTGSVKSENLVVDRIDYGTGLQVEDGDATDPASWEELWLDDDEALNKYGVIQKSSGVYFLRGGIEIGDSSSTATTLWSDATNSTVVFEAPTYLWSTKRVELSAIDAPNLYAIDIVGNGTGTTDVDFGTVVGSGDDRQGILGGVIASAGPKFTIDAETDIADLDTVNFYGVTLQGAGVTQFSSSTKTDIIGCNFINCDEVQPNDAEFLNCKVIAPIPNLGVEIVSGSTVKQVDFISGSGDNIPLDRVWQVDVSTTPDTYVDFTSEAEDATTGDLVFFPAAEGIGDYCAFGCREKFGRLRVDTGTVRVGGSIAWDYYSSASGGSWVTFSTDDKFTDATNELSATGFKNVTVSQPPPSDWIATSINGEDPIFYIRARVVTTFSTNPIGDQCEIAQRTECMAHFPTALTQTAEAWKFFGTGTDQKFDIENSEAATLCDSYATTNANTVQAFGDATVYAAGQSFTGNGGVLSSARIYLQKTTGASQTITASVYAHTGSFGSTGTPTGAALATSNGVAASGLAAATDELHYFEFEDEVTLTAATNYFLVLEVDTQNGTQHPEWAIDTSVPSHGGNFATRNSGGTWSAASTTDAVFYLHTGAITTVNATEGANPVYDASTDSQPGAIIINNAVALTVNVADEDGNDVQDARVYIEDSGGTQLMNELTTAGGVATETYNYSSDEAITVRVRKSSTGSTRYFPVQTTGTITTDGFTVDITLTQDLIASA